MENDFHALFNPETILMKTTLKTLAIVAALAASGVAMADSATLQKVKDTQNINLGVRDSSGLSFTIGNGKYVGFHTEMGENIIRDVRGQLGLSSLTTTYVPVNSQNRIPLVQNGTVDLECGSTTNTLARQKDVAFANTTYLEEVRMAVKADSNIKTFRDLEGKTVVTTTGTTSVQTLRKDKRAEGIQFKDIQGKDHADSHLLLESGRADAFVMDTSILASNIAKSKNPKAFKIVGEPLSVEPIACMVRKDDPEFLAAVNASIARQVGDGTLARLYDKWFLQPIPPTNTSLNMPLSDGTKTAWAVPNNKPMEDYNAK